MDSGSRVVVCKVKLTASGPTDEIYLALYSKVASSRLSGLVAHLRIFRLFMKGQFDAYVL